MGISREELMPALRSLAVGNYLIFYLPIEDSIEVVKTLLAIRAKMKLETQAFFVSERRGPLNRRTAWLAIRNYGEQAGLAMPAHPHQLRHACGFALADQGADTRLIQDYLGHRHLHGDQSGPI